MSLLYFDGEYIEIPEYIVRIVKRAQTKVSEQTINCQKNPIILTNGELVSEISSDDLDPTVLGPDGTRQTVSEYILGIIRTAQKIVLESRESDDIKDYDRFIENTFDAMLNEADGETSEDSNTLVQGVVEKLIDEVCRSPKLKMPELDNSLVTESAQESSEIIHQNDDVKIVTSSESDDSEPEKDKIDTTEVAENQQKSEDENLSSDGSACENTASANEEDTQEDDQEKQTDDKVTVSDEELEEIAEKFVVNICNEAKNILLNERDNNKKEVINETCDQEKITVKSQSDKKSQKNEETEETPNGKLEQKPDTDSDEQSSQNHSAKVHPEESQPVGTHIDDITQTDSQTTEGKPGKDQKHHVPKDKIKSKRKSRGIRNSFRRMFSCFSTKSSQLE